MLDLGEMVERRDMMGDGFWGYVSLLERRWYIADGNVSLFLVLFFFGFVSGSHGTL